MPQYPFGLLPEFDHIEDEVERGFRINILRTRYKLDVNPLNTEYNCLQMFNYLGIGDNENAALQALYMVHHFKPDNNLAEFLAFASFISGDYFFNTGTGWDKGAYLELIINAINLTGNGYFKNQCTSLLVKYTRSYIDYLENLPGDALDMYDLSGPYHLYLIEYGYRLIAWFSEDSKEKSEALSAVKQLGLEAIGKFPDNAVLHDRINEIFAELDITI